MPDSGIPGQELLTVLCISPASPVKSTLTRVTSLLFICWGWIQPILTATL